MRSAAGPSGARTRRWQRRRSWLCEITRCELRSGRDGVNTRYAAVRRHGAVLAAAIGELDVVPAHCLGGRVERIGHRTFRAYRPQVVDGVEDQVGQGEGAVCLRGGEVADALAWLPDCALSQAAALVGEAWESQASWITSASSCTVSSPIRLPRISTDGWPSKCDVVKNGEA